MARIVIELTNRCNLSCTHCFDGRHSADGDLRIEIIEKILVGAKAHGFDYLAFTGETRRCILDLERFLGWYLKPDITLDLSLMARILQRFMERYFPTYAYFEGFDQPWKVSSPWEPFWGLFRQNRTPKLFISWNQP